jgi:RNA polymerase sigma-70 factor (ECF subfamily)
MAKTIELETAMTDGPKSSSAGEGTGPSDVSRRLAVAIAERRSEFVAFVRRRVHDVPTAEDLVDETLARALGHVGELRDHEAVCSWFYRALRNAIVDHHRRHGTADRALEQWAAETDAITPATEHAEPRVCCCVLKVAASLKPEYADALERIEVSGEAVRAFAEARGISSSNAGVRVFRAREALRRGLIAACGACADSGCADCTCEDHA